MRKENRFETVEVVGDDIYEIDLPCFFFSRNRRDP